ncbi:response regulator transcription factor [Micromonospora polyrhachis]|uniref:DNA-binding NarL/FixJ family response regulator n=1 Tax=Micromonospora polyrhachis TaxID=1282883 RepID=A0A7W7WMY1_9ACTN|nr:response regulator transcription factor [Micromonospora polyrhachis]MBB4956643.1 DNA-binding NarL/FixJ family response regulator [Micromonospora polyrhachis]
MLQGGDTNRTILVVDDHPVVRRGMLAMFAVEPETTTLIEAGTADDARRLATLDRPDIAIVDLILGDGAETGLDLIRDLLTIAPACTVVVVTMANDPQTVLAALRAGARGYLLKDTAPEMLVAAVQTAAVGGRVLGPKVDDSGLAGPEPRRVPAPFAGLTPRELRLVTMLADGRSNREIAAALVLSEKTVRNQISIIIAKLGVADRVQVALLANRAGLRG